ncbi:hypothetical protein ACLOJK_018815, partial [Asimina triloba]
CRKVVRTAAAWRRRPLLRRREGYRICSLTMVVESSPSHRHFGWIRSTDRQLVGGASDGSQGCRPWSGWWRTEL